MKILKKLIFFKIQFQLRLQILTTVWERVQTAFPKSLFFLLKIIFFYVLDHFNALISKIILKK